MRTRLEIYRAIGQITAGDKMHLHMHLASIRPMLAELLASLPDLPALFVGLEMASKWGTHGELVRQCLAVHELIRGK
jgi:hypothetical protein